MTAEAVQLTEPQSGPPATGPGRRSARYLRALTRPKGYIGLSLVVLIVLAAVLGPVLVAYGPNEQGPDALTSPGGKHLLGTDEVGRDLLSRVLAGTRVDLIITLAAVPVAALAGILLGLVGYLSPLLGALFQRIFDVLLGIPAIVLGVAVAIAVTPGQKSVMIAIVLVTMPIFGRQTRSALNGQLPLDYVSAGQVLGYSRWRILFRHVLPNIVDVLLVRFAIEMAHAIMIEGGLSVIGLGIQSPAASLGSMIKDGGSYLLDTPMYAMAPVAVVVVLVVGYTLLADALNEEVLRK